jgi:1-acyl-sn-glycerol-3-phosphate acyltransferase
MSEAPPESGLDADDALVAVAERATAMVREQPVTVIDQAISGALWAAGLSWMIPVMGSMMAAAVVKESDQTDWLNRLYCRGQLALTGARWTAVVHPDIDPDQPYVFCQNHVNLLDHVTMYCATPHFKQGLELSDHFDIPVYGWFMRQRGTIPVYRGSRDAFDKLKEGFAREVAKGHSILAFPEGTRSRTGRVGKFRKGVFMAAAELGIPVVPVAVTGMYEILRPGSKLFRPGREVTVYCDAPIATAGLSAGEVPALARRVQAVVSERVDRYWERRMDGA